MHVDGLLLLPPKRVKVRSCKTRSSLAWTSGATSRNLVEEERAGMRQFEIAGRRSMAPVNEPRSWPNIPLLDQRFGNRRAVERDERTLAAAAELMNGLGTSSLPVPDSPYMSTDAAVGEACSMTRYTARSAGALPTISPNRPCSCSWR